MNPLYLRITKRLKLGKATYEWAKDYFGVWHRSKAGILEDAIDSYSDSIPACVFNKKLESYIGSFKDMHDLLCCVASIADAEGFQ